MLATIIVGTATAAAIALAVISIVRARKNNRKCDGNCANCSRNSGCR